MKIAKLENEILKLKSGKLESENNYLKKRGMGVYGMGLPLSDAGIKKIFAEIMEKDLGIKDKPDITNT